MLSVEVVALVVGLTWGLAGIFWVVILWWGRTSVTEARRRELDQERSEGVSLGIRVWRLTATGICAVIPALFVVDGLVDDLDILYAPGLSFLAGPDGGWVNAQVLRANGGFA